MTTKEQERQAIAKIRKIVEGLGENSYVGTAMEGVLEVAEENIEYDAAFSLKGRAELAEKREAELKKKNETQAESLAKMAEALKKAEDEKAELRNQVGQFAKEIQRLWLPENTYRVLKAMIEERGEESKQAMDEAAILMSEYVGENKVSENIHDAAADFRRRRKQVSDCRMILEELKRYERKEG